MWSVSIYEIISFSADKWLYDLQDKDPKKVNLSGNGIERLNFIVLSVYTNAESINHSTNDLSDINFVLSSPDNLKLVYPFAAKSIYPDNFLYL